MFRLKDPEDERLDQNLRFGDVVLQKGGFLQTFAELEATARWTPVEKSPPFRAFAIAEPQVLVQTFVFRIL